MKIEQRLQSWITSAIDDSPVKPNSCMALKMLLGGYISTDFLAKCVYFVVDELPFPHELLTVKDYQDMQLHRAVAFGRHYFIRPQYVNVPAVHLHQLVHCLQWEIMGQWYISEFVKQLQTFGYKNAPMEQTAQFIEDNYSSKGAPIDVMQLVYRSIV